MDEKNRVAVFRANLLPISETFIRDQVSAMRSWTPILIGRENVKGGLETPGIPREIVPEPGNRLVRALRFWLWRPDPALVARLKQLNCKLAHVHFGFDATDFWPSIKAAGLPMLVTLHGGDINIHRWWWEQGHNGLKRRVYPRRLLRIAREPSVHFIAVSEAIKRRAIEYGIPEEKISVSYIGVDADRFKPGVTPIEQRARRILFVGRMVEKKAPLLLIRAFAEVKKHVPDAELVMIGTGPLLASAKELAHQVGTPVEFLGSCTSDQVVTQLQLAQVFCLPSITTQNGDAEGLPISILEANACGVPVITSARGGIHEAIQQDQNGAVFKEGDLAGLIHALHQLLTDPDRLVCYSRKAIETINQKFRTSKTTNILEGKIYDSCDS